MPSGIDLLTENDRNVTLPSFFYGCLFVMNIDIDIRISFTVTLVYASTLLYQSSGYRRNITPALNHNPHQYQSDMLSTWN